MYLGMKNDPNSTAPGGKPKNTMPELARKHSEIELRIDSLAFGGKGLGRLNGEFVVFVAGTIPGDLVRARVIKRKPQYAEAKILEILEPSPDRRAPRCPLFGQCGGCRIQNLGYDLQCAWKQRQVADALRIPATKQTDPFTVEQIIPSPSEWRYRNKMELSFGMGAEGESPISIGLHRAGFWSVVLNCEDCYIAPEVFARTADFFRKEFSAMYAADPRICAYDQKTHVGLLRSLVLRHSLSAGKFLTALITNDAPWFAQTARDLGRRFMSAFPDCRGFLWGTTAALSDISVPEKICLELGENIIEETLGARTYRVSPFSFFQTNSAGAALLYDKVREFAALDEKPGLVLLDAYCGTGTIGVHCADKAARVVGIELVESAVTDARHNAERNGFTNCDFYAGDMRRVLARLQAEGGLPRFDRVIVDPPRGGMEAKALKLLLDLGAPLIVYVSCNPATLARDTEQMIESGYAIRKVQPIDMFPHTFHVETVVLLSKLKSTGI